MADKTLRLVENVSGAYYITEECINCGLCEAVAPDNIHYDEESGAQVVFKQPDSSDETSQLQEAMESCPVAAIGDDGDS